MTIPSTMNVFSQILNMQGIMPIGSMLSERLDYDVSGNLLYIGYSPIPRAALGDKVWFIRKVNRNGEGKITYLELPVDGQQFTYSWNDRSTYFE